MAAPESGCGFGRINARAAKIPQTERPHRFINVWTRVQFLSSDEREANPLSQSLSSVAFSSGCLQINFMYFHAGRVIRTDGWQSLLASCPDIANSVVRRLSEFHDESVSARDPIQ